MMQTPEGMESVDQDLNAVLPAIDDTDAHAIVEDVDAKLVALLEAK